jgi:hypothetical protein
MQDKNKLGQVDLVPAKHKTAEAATISLDKKKYRKNLNA